MHAQWKIFSSGTPMLASQPLSLVLGAANDVTMIDERWWAPQWPDWPAAKTSWFARRIYPLPQTQKSAAAATSDQPAAGLVEHKAATGGRAIETADTNKDRVSAGGEDAIAAASSK
jgi:hypothetical protein